MKIFFFGQRSFGAAVLRRLIEDGHTITGTAVPEPDQYYDKVHILAIKENLAVLPAGKIRSADIPGDTELIVAAHSHHFISEKALQRAKHGGIGYHPSALPRHRGRDAVRWTVAMRDPITAGTVYWLDNLVDGGDILSQRFIHVSPSEDHHALWRRLFELGVDMLSDAVSSVASDHAEREHQSWNYATWEPPFNDHARLHRPDLLAITGATDKSENHCVLGRVTCGPKYPCDGCRFQEKNPLCAHGLWKCPLGNAICNSACVWFNSEEESASKTA
jgi:methionyl-tRNA formyltransferase